MYTLIVVGKSECYLHVTMNDKRRMDVSFFLFELQQLLKYGKRISPFTTSEISMEESLEYGTRNNGPKKNSVALKNLHVE